MKKRIKWRNFARLIHKDVCVTKMPSGFCVTADTESGKKVIKGWAAKVLREAVEQEAIKKYRVADRVANELLLRLGVSHVDLAQDGAE